MTVALAIFTRSPSAYEALKSIGILQLPSQSLLQSYTGTFYMTLVQMANALQTRLPNTCCSR